MKITKTLCMLLFTAVLIVSATGCTDRSSEPELTAKKLYELYPGDIELVDRIDIVNGGTGERKSFADRQAIKDWIQDVRSLELVPDPNQEDRTGYLYDVALYENKELKYRFTNVSIGEYYILHNEALVEALQTLFESKQ